jgi:hypothetical protein
MKRILRIAGIAVVAAACVAPFLPLPFLRPSLEQALAKRLGRPVDIDEVSLTLFTGPGFALSGVTIHEDPRAGIEPFVYAPTVDARVDWIGLIGGHRGFSSLRLADATINLVQTGAGAWNFQYLLEARLTDAPALHLRGARVNLKLGDTKALAYFDDADIDVSPGSQGVVDVSFAGVPGRTDRAAQSSARLFVHSSWIPASADRPLNIKVELEPSSLDAMAKLFGRTWFDLQGQVSLNAQLAGVPSRLAVAGEVQLDEARRSDFLPKPDAKWKLPFRGTMDLLAGKLELETAANATSAEVGGGQANSTASGGDAPFAAWRETADLWTAPRWKASLSLHDAPLGEAIDAMRQAAALLPEVRAGRGTVSGELHYDGDSGLAGNLEARDAELNFADSPTVRSTVPVKIAAQTVTFGPAAFAVGEDESAQIEASYKFDGSAAADVRVTTRALAIGALKALISGPLLDPAGARKDAGKKRSPQEDTEGINEDGAGRSLWRGAIHYWRVNPEVMAWAGDYTVENVQIPIEGAGVPVRIQSAAVSANQGHLAITKIKGEAGSIRFTGEYHWDAEGKARKTGGQEAASPYTFKVQIAEADAGTLHRLLRAMLVPPRGSPLSASSAPEWLAQKHAEGTVAVAKLSTPDKVYAIESARAVWDGSAVRFSSIKARSLGGETAGGALAGEATFDLTRADGVKLELRAAAGTSRKPAR